MSYATLVEFKARVGTRTSPPGLYEQMTDRVSATTASDTIGQMLIEDAEAEVNGYLARRYAVPMDVSSDATLAAWLKRCTCILATYNGWAEHPKMSANRENVKALHDEVIAQLTAIANGKMDPPAQGTPTSASGGSSSGEAIGNTRVFTEDAMTGL